MAKFFSQSDIDLFKECFFFNATRGYTTDERQLGMIMMSLSYSPTTEEVHQYFQKYVKDGKIDFAAFLDIMHDHSMKENAIKEIMEAFRAQDTDKKGYVSVQEARHILTQLGDGLSRHEVEALFREGNVSGQQLRYQEFISSLTTPVPDY